MRAGEDAAGFLGSPLHLHRMVRPLEPACHSPGHLATGFARSKENRVAGISQLVKEKCAHRHHGKSLLHLSRLPRIYLAILITPNCPTIRPEPPFGIEQRFSNLLRCICRIVRHSSKPPTRTPCRSGIWSASYAYTAESFRGLLQSQDMRSEIQMWTTTEDRRPDRNEFWLNALLRNAW